MLPNVTYKSLGKIEFPVFILPSDDVTLEDGLLLHKGRVIDDRNMPGETLGLRRLQTPHKTLNFKRLCPDLAAMLRSKQLNFIDSKGRAFHYKKTVFVHLKYKKIKKVQNKEIASLLWVVGVPTPFTIPRPPPAGHTWVGLLYSNQFPWKIYEYSRSKLPNSRKKI